MLQLANFNLHVFCRKVPRIRHLGLLRRRHTSSRCTTGIGTSLMKQLHAKIKLTGPITVADYMREVLTNSQAGYYMNKDVFGEHGDFITSPEISQMFGELLGVWCVNEWLQHGSPSRIQLVELGPGRGTLTDDMLRVFSKFSSILDAVSVHLVEISPKLSEMQYAKLTDSDSNTQHVHPESGEEHPYQTCKSKYGPSVHWYNQLGDVPKGFSCYVAHEFLDALPIHKFQYKDGEWHEVLVDIDTTAVSQLRLVLSKQLTAANHLLSLSQLNVPGDHVELCPEAGLLVQQLATRIHENGGFALLADYGHTGEKTDTFRAFRKHQLCDPLHEPGNADLTADVNFSYLKSCLSDKVCSFGPITQQEFLHNMGISTRLQVLLKDATESQRADLMSAYDMLTNTTKMGERFKFYAILHGDVKSYIPAGFQPQE